MLALGGLENFLEQEGTDALGSQRHLDHEPHLRRRPAVRRQRLADLRPHLDRPLPAGEREPGARRPSSSASGPSATCAGTTSSGPGRSISSSAGLAFRHREGSSIQAGQVNQVQSAINSDSWRPELQIGLRNGMASRSPGPRWGRTTANTAARRCSTRTRWPAPSAIPSGCRAAFGRVRRQVRSSISALYSRVRTCLEQADEHRLHRDLRCDAGRSCAAVSIPTWSAR